MLDVTDLINTKAALPFSIKLEELSESLGRKVSISDQIAEVLRNLIISGELNPGDRIVESRVAKQLGVGQPTVREALVTLEHQGLVVRKTNQGCIVTILLEITRAMRAAGDEKDVNGFFSHDFRFHETLWKASGNIFLPRLLSQLMLPLMAFLFIRNLRHNSHIDMGESAEAHAELAKVILLRDKVKARTVAEQKFKMFSDQHLNLYNN